MKYLIRVFSDVIVTLLIVLMATAPQSIHGDLAEAEEFASASSDLSYPFNRTFTISAYYSPLPCQNRYVTGSYEGDIRLNGSGVNSADGTPVYPGMIAAPRNYPFGTKMDIPGVGIVAVHDRGGAIKATNGMEGVYDRLDVWMGYGDKGLQRALSWGKRTFDVVVYGINDSIAEQIVLDNYSSDEANPNDCVMPPPVKFADSGVEEAAKTVPSPQSNISPRLGVNLTRGSSGDNVKVLQNQLKALNYFKDDVTGYYGEVTEHAVFKFQQSQRLVGDKNSLGAGIFGPKTRDRMNEIIASKDYTTVRVAQATEEHQTRILVEAEKNRILTSELQFGMVGPEVAALQRFLKSHGYFKGALITDYYGPVTMEAVLNFQLDNNLINSANEYGAGRVGPSTLQIINTLS